MPPPPQHTSCKRLCRLVQYLLVAALSLLLLAMLVLAYPTQYYTFFAPWLSPTRAPQHVRTVSNIQPDQVQGLLQQAYRKDFPLVIRGGVQHWEAAGTWSPQHIRELVGSDTEVVLQSGVQEQQASPFTRTTMGAFTDWLARQEKDTTSTTAAASTPHKVYYLAEEFDFIESHDALADQIELHELDTFWERRSTDTSWSSWCEWLLSAVGVWYEGPRRSNSLQTIGQSTGFETAFWMGGAGARTGWHIDHDYPLNVLCHLVGSKTLWIAHPTQGQNMYPSNKYDPGAVLGQVNFWEPNYQLYPKYANVTYEKVVLAPGDVLFIPMGYWHAAESTTYTTSVSLRSMTAWYWLRNFPDRLLEWTFFNGWWRPSEGSTANEVMVDATEL